MASVRTSFALDPIADHDLIERLATLERGEISRTIREALYQYFEMQPSLADVMKRLDELEMVVLSRGVVIPASTEPEPRADVSDLDAKLNKTLGRFRRDK